VEILSGVFEGKSTGAPIALLIRNRRQRSRDYTPFKDIFRPGHADFTFWQKYGIRDYKGGGRSSGRETAGRVASGAIARKILEDNGVKIRAFALEIGGVRAETLDLAEIEKNPVRTPDAQAAERMKQAILDAKEANNSVGGIVQLQVTGLPAGLGDPVFGKLDARLGGALLSIGAIKGFEVGDGFEVAQKTGRENNDEMKDGKFLTNHCGGVLGGISTGEPVVIRLAFKPTASISQVQQASDIHGANHELIVEGRHDPCIIPRAIPVVESMTALCLLDVWEIQARLKRISSCFDMFKTDA
jgi:chorismate synthase